MSSNDAAQAQPATDMADKGKGKQAEQPQSGDMSMDEDESSGEESGPEEVSDSIAS